MLERIPNHTRIVISVVASAILSSVLVFFIDYLFGLTDFESFILGMTFFIAWHVLVIWDRHERSLTTLEETSKKHASLRRRTRKFLSQMLNIMSNYDAISNEVAHKKSKNISDKFIVDLYERKIDSINTDLNSLNRDGSVEIATNIFKRYPHEIFNISKNTAEFYAIADCGEGLRWLCEPDGMSYLENINMKVEAKKIHRLFVYEPNDKVDAIAKITPIVEICFQLHKNSGYEIKKIERETLNDIYVRTNNPEIVNDFGIYGKNFVWEKMRTSSTSKKGKLYVKPSTIKVYQDIFNEAWNHTKASEISVANDKVIKACEGKNISDLYNVINEWGHSNEFKYNSLQSISTTNATAKNDEQQPPIVPNQQHQSNTIKLKNKITIFFKNLLKK